MKDSNAVLVGVVAAIVLTPLVMAAWKKISPAAHHDANVISAYAWAQFRRIQLEATIATCAAIVLLTFTFGFRARMDAALTAIFLGTIVFVPTYWPLLRTTLKSPSAVLDFAACIETKYGVSFRSVLVVGAIGLLAALLGFLTLASRSNT